MKKKNRIFGKVLMVLMIAFFYVPILYMIVFSFNDGKSLTSFSGFFPALVSAHAGVAGYDDSFIYDI